MFSLGCPKCTKHMKHSYRGCSGEGVPVYANICSLGLKGIQSICGNFTHGVKLLMKKSVWASWVWPPSQTITIFCTINCSSTCPPDFAELDLLLLLTSSSIRGSSPLLVPEWWAVSRLTFGAGGVPCLGRTAVSCRCCCPTPAGDTTGSPCAIILLCTVCPRTGVVLQRVGVHTVYSLCMCTCSPSICYAASFHREWMICSWKADKG